MNIPPSSHSASCIIYAQTQFDALLKRISCETPNEE